MTASLATVSYIGATILFILSLGGLSQSRDRRGAATSTASIGMAIAVLATVFGPRVTPAGYRLDHRRAGRRRRRSASTPRRRCR